MYACMHASLPTKTESIPSTVHFQCTHRSVVALWVVQAMPHGEVREPSKGENADIATLSLYFTPQEVPQITNDITSLLFQTVNN